MLYYNKITEKEGIDKTNGQDCHGKTNIKPLRMLLLFKLFFLYLKTSNMILIYVIIAIVVNKEKKCLTLNS